MADGGGETATAIDGGYHFNDQVCTWFRGQNSNTTVVARKETATVECAFRAHVLMYMDDSGTPIFLNKFYE